MKKIFISLTAMLTTFLFVSCLGEDENWLERRYDVSYQLKTVIPEGEKIEVHYATPEGIGKETVVSEGDTCRWSAEKGPFKKGNVVTLKVFSFEDGRMHLTDAQTVSSIVITKEGCTRKQRILGENSISHVIE